MARNCFECAVSALDGDTQPIGGLGGEGSGEPLLFRGRYRSRVRTGTPQLLGDSINASSGMCPAAGLPFWILLGDGSCHSLQPYGCPGCVIGERAVLFFGS